MQRRVAIYLIFVLCMVLNSGCWDQHDLTKMAIAVAVGYDRIASGDIELTVQIVRPDIIRAKPRGSEKEASKTYSATGQTVFAAVRNLLETVDRKVFWSHTQLIVIGEKGARQGITDLLDYLERDHETNRLAPVLIGHDMTAKEIVEAQSELEELPALHLKDLVMNNKSLAKIREIRFNELLTTLNTPGYNPAIGVIHRTNQDEKLQIKDLKVEGLAVFQGDKLVGWLDEFETRGYLFAKNQVQSGIIDVVNPKDEGKFVAFEIVRSSGKMDAIYQKGRLKFMIDIKAEGRLGDQQGGGNLLTDEMVLRLEKEVEREIRDNIKSALQKVQSEYGSDIFGFSEIVHKKYLNYWKQIKDNWQEIFVQTPVVIKVDWKTRSSGLIKNSTD